MSALRNVVELTLAARKSARRQRGEFVIDPDKLPAFGLRPEDAKKVEAACLLIETNTEEVLSRL